ncbi:hypothetical protein [Phytopseudomonas flavescens]|nr:hypothetical protein [Pseudomonas flavescens]
MAHSTRIAFSPGQLLAWAGMGNYLLLSPDARHEVELIYLGEPPHGDSYHRVIIDGHALPGFAWGDWFSMSACSRYLSMSWMPACYERHTLLVDMLGYRYTRLPAYMGRVQIDWPILRTTDEPRGPLHHQMDARQKWYAF